MDKAPRYALHTLVRFNERGRSYRALGHHYGEVLGAQCYNDEWAYTLQKVEQHEYDPSSFIRLGTPMYPVLLYMIPEDVLTLLEGVTAINR